MPGTGAGMGMGGGSFPSMGMGVGGGMTAEEEEFETYSLETVTVATVTAQERVTLSITVDEQDVAKLSVGQTADMTVDALVGEKFTATVTAISASGENEGGSSKFTVELTAEKSADMLPGMRANVSLATAMAESVIAIPVAALQESGAQAQVYTGYDEETESYTDPVTVETGVSDGEYVQILSGLEAGQTVYYPYYDTLIVSNVPQMSGGFSFG